MVLQHSVMKHLGCKIILAAVIVVKITLSSSVCSMSNQPAAGALKEAQDKLSQCRRALSAMTQSFVAGNGRDNAELVLVAKDKQHISVDRNLATSFSKYFEASSSTGMKEAAGRMIWMDDIDSKVLRSMIVYLIVGPLDCDKIVIPLPKLRSMEAFQLMDVSTRLLMPDVCSKIAHDIDEIADLDLEFYLSAQAHAQTSGPDYQPAWSTVCNKALKAISLNIEKYASDPLFSKLSIEDLHQVIENVSDLPECWMDQDDVSSGFRLEITEKDNSVSARVYVTKDNPISLRIGKEDGGLYHFGVRLENSKNKTQKDFQQQDQTRYFGNRWGWPSFFGEKDWMELKADSPLKFSFSARMSILHRRCFALMNYVSATFQAERNDCLRFSGSKLLKSLQHFHKIEGEPAQKCAAALLDYAALSFNDIIAEEALMAADASILCALIGRDSLFIEHEGAVLKLVAQWAMKQQQIQAASPSEARSTMSEVDNTAFSESHVGADGIGQGNASGASHATGVASRSGPLVGPNAALISNIEKLLKLVRFPSIPFASICTSGAGLTSAERALFKTVPCYSGLVAEAAKLQILQSSDGHLAKKPKNTDLTVVKVPRSFYKDKAIPALDTSFFATALL